MISSSSFFNFLSRRKDLILTFLFLPLLIACNKQSQNPISELCKRLSINCLSGNQIVRVYTNKGNMTFELYADIAPITVSNFIDLVNQGFYQNKTFYRVVREPFDFIAQVGDSEFEKLSIRNNTKLIDKSIEDNYLSGRFIPLEIKLVDEQYPRYGKKIKDPNILKKITLKHNSGSLSMARSESINSASSQFFISLKALPVLDGRYSVFGNLIKGNNVLELIKEGDVIEKIILLQK